MCSSLLTYDYASFDLFFKRDLLTLVDDRVITVRMTLARILTASQVGDKDVSFALTKLSKDTCGDIRELVTSHIKQRSESIISESAGEATQADSMDEMSV